MTVVACCARMKLSFLLLPYIRLPRHAVGRARIGSRYAVSDSDTLFGPFPFGAPAEPGLQARSGPARFWRKGSEGLSQTKVLFCF